MLIADIHYIGNTQTLDYHVIGATDFSTITPPSQDITYVGAISLLHHSHHRI